PTSCGIWMKSVYEPCRHKEITQLLRTRFRDSNFRTIALRKLRGPARHGQPECALHESSGLYMRPVEHVQKRVPMRSCPSNWRIPDPKHWCRKPSTEIVLGNLVFRKRTRLLQSSLKRGTVCGGHMHFQDRRLSRGWRHSLR